MSFLRYVLSLIFAFSVLSGFAQTKQIKELEHKRKLALEEIKNTSLLLNQTKKNTTTLLDRINLLSEQIKSRQNVISLLGQEVSAIENQQSLTEKEIKDLEIKLKNQQVGYSKALESMVLRKKGMNNLIFILSGNSLGESFRRLKYLKDYSEWRTNQIHDIREKQVELKQKKQELAKSKNDKLALLKSRETEKSSLSQEEITHKKEVEEATLKQKELQEILANKQKQANNLNAQIEKLIAREVERQERQARKEAEQRARLKRERELASKKKNKTTTTTPEPESTVPSVTQTELDDAPVAQENIKLSSNFASNKGKLPMPITGAYSIVGRFGAHQHSKFRVTTNSGGIDIQAQAGAQARSVFDGEVTRVVAFPGYNNCIIVRHGGYYSFYGNIQQISVTQGQRVKAGQSLGRVYTDSDTGKAQLHFQLWKGTTKLNPEPWLRK